MAATFFASLLFIFVFFLKEAPVAPRGAAECPATSDSGEQRCNCDGYDYMSPNHPWKRDKKGFKLKDGSEKLMWFVQVPSFVRFLRIP
jgi:hypothetical protein